MGWQVALVADEETNVATLLGWLPVWARSTPQLRASANELRKSWESCWSPEPELTLINTPVGDNVVEWFLDEIPTIELHHPRMTAVRIFGLGDSPALREGLSALGYRFICASDYPWLLFSRPMSALENVPVLELDAVNWRSRDDVYDAFFKAVGAPEWHGRCFDALNDSITTGGINKIEVPYRIVVRGARGADSEAADFLKELADLLGDFGAKGCPVEMRVEQ